jgi:DNA replication protein DnaC
MANVASLPIMLKELKLAGFTQHWEDLAQKALDEQWLPQQYLAELCAQETSVRCHRRLQRYLRESQLPPAKQLSRFDFADAQGITKAQIMALVQQTYWVKQAENVLLFGASGVGKTHLACGIAYALIEQGHRVKFTTATHLVQSLQHAKETLRLAEVLTRMDKYTVLIIDDIGYVKKDNQETMALFELIAHRYETGSLIITSNQPFSDWDQIFDSGMMAVAAIDRLVHHATILEMGGESYRMKASMQRRGGKKVIDDN